MNKLSLIDYDDGFNFENADKDFFDLDETYVDERVVPSTLPVDDDKKESNTVPESLLSPDISIQNDSLYEDNQPPTVDQITPGIEENIDEVFIEESEPPIVDMPSIDELLYSWANNSIGKMHEKNILNILLLGVDEPGRSDSIILASLNKTTLKLTLTSILRDSYTYMNINGHDRYYILGAASFWGGPATTIRTIENNYKIKIDSYISVNFNNFENIIDHIGGLNIELTEAEANHLISMGHKVNPGINTLSGSTTLAFARIRKIDSDVQRVRRQRDILLSIIEKAKISSISEINDAVEHSLGHVKTNMSKGEILSLTAQATANGWRNSDICQFVSPQKDNRRPNPYGIRGLWTWVVDYPAEAQALQNLLYGKTNIRLEANRINIFDIH